MFLKNIELRGFKSFAEPVKIEFQQGINAIVGPNGSGKSNIVDAIRWVLGEQSMKSLRSSKLGDIIFSGSNLKRPMGMADVSVTLDNSSHLLPVEFSEVCFTRRVFRSGESEFYINKVPCRLKDIQELLMDSGIGKDGYSIIGQGSIDEILACRPEERRYIFEEIAGIMKYKTRKSEAQRRLKETTANIERIQYILNEIKNQLEPLSLQRERALEYRRLKAECKKLDINLQLSELDKNREKIDSINVLIKKNLDKLSLSETSLKEIQNKIATYNRELDIKNIEGDALEKQLLVVEKEANDIKEKIQAEERRKLRLDDRIENLTNLKDDLNNKNETTIGLMKISQDKLEKEAQDILLMKDAISEKEAVIQRLDDEIARKEGSIDSLKGSILDLIGNVSKKRNYISELKARKENLLERKKDIKLEISDLETTRVNIQKDIADGKRQLQAQQEILSESKEVLISYSAKLRKLQEEIGTQEKLQEEKWQELSTIASKRKALEDITKNYGGFNFGVKNLLTSLEKGRYNCSGIYGCVADLILVKEEYELAIETALGSAAQNIVCKSEEEAKAAVNFLKENRLGRATFLPLTTIRHRNLRDKESFLLTQRGCIGKADELISFDDKYSNIMGNLLGRVIVAKTLDKAVELAKACNFSLKIVTIDGQLINPGGAITGGSRRRSSFILSRKQQIQTYQTEEALLEEKLNEIRGMGLSSKNKKREVENLLENHKTHLSESKFRISVLEKKLEDMFGLLEKNEEEKTRLKLNISKINREIDEIDKKISSLEAEVGDTDYKNIDNQSKAQELQVELSQDRIRREELAKRLTDLKVQLASKQQKHVNIKEILREHQMTLEKRKLGLKSIKDELLEARHQREISEENLVEHNKKNKDLERSLLTLKERLHQIKSDKISFKDEIDNARDKIEKLRDQTRVLEKKDHKFELKLTTLEVETQKIGEWLKSTYGISLREAEKFKQDIGEIDEARSKLALYRDQLKSLGAVNLQAIEDYDKLKSRFDFIQDQENDLINAKDNLDVLINDITRVMETMFLESFNIVKKEFARVFKELFGGGRAELTVSEGANLLEAGIEIVAQPPGKKLQSLSLLSGGERALTAIALLFAILNVKATPFCILDEIEATLDDANIGRFTKYLKKVSKHTQVIVVTHRKSTMEVADVLYGVSMEDTAISKILSVKID